MKKLDKEMVFKNCARVLGEKLDLSSVQMTMVIDLFTEMFTDVDLITHKNELSTETVANDVLIKNYLGCLKLRGRKDSTLTAYSVTLKHFCNFIKTDLLKVDTNEIRRYLLHYEKTVSKSTADNARRNLNSFYSFLVDENYLLKNPVKRIGKIKDDTHYKKFYSDMEMEMIRDSCISKKELALVDLLLSSGLRVSEVSIIKIDEIDWENRVMIIHGKGGKDRPVPFSARAKKHLQEYLIERDYESKYLFCSSRKPHHNLGSGSIQAIIKQIGKRAGLPNITVHCFRRWLATDLYRKGVEPEVIQSILGHSSYETTMKHYLSLSLDKTLFTHEIFVA